MRKFRDYIKEKVVLQEVSDATRYSVETNYRSTPEEVLENFAKISLGYVSAGLKQHNFHVKHVFTEKPVRILVSSRNWDDGEWVVTVSWNPEHKCFVVSKGYYNKDRRTVSIQSSEKCQGDNAAEITKQVFNLMHHLKGQPDRHQEKLKPAKLRPGPKS